MLLQVSSQQLRDDLMTLLIAGHETTAAVLTWTVHCLLDHPEFMAQLQEEVSVTPPRLTFTSFHFLWQFNLRPDCRVCWDFLSTLRKFCLFDGTPSNESARMGCSGRNCCL